ncbi:MAG TPA: AIM24 family protein [Blastocatellia bacterium]|nr:AIM24 family protein [Blastocatellia bacterium]
MANFQLKNKRLLEVTLNNEKVMARTGAMVAYDGNIKFEKSVTGGEGFFGALKRRVTGESLDMMTASGMGVVYFARNAIEITIVPLQNEKIFIESSSLLAFEPHLRTSTAFAGLRGATTGQGLFTTTIEGMGNLAVISHGGLIMLEVTPSTPLCVDPDAFVAYKGNVTQEFIFDVNWKTMIGQTSGESFQLKFSGMGVVYIQPSERK